MGFFAEFNAWLNALLAGYIADNVARIAATLEPAIVTLGILYVMVWGYLQLTGPIEEPFIHGVKRIITLAVILGCALSLWLYNSVIVDTFFNAPSELGAILLGAFDPVGIVDQIIFEGGDAANLLLQKGSLLSSNFAYYLAGIGVYLIVGLTAIYTIFLLALSRIALSVLLALGPLFIALLLFDTTKRFFEAWLAQLANYAFIAMLAVLVAALMLRVVTVAAQPGCERGRLDSDRERGPGLHGRGAHLSRHAPGDADGGGAGERTCALVLRGRERGARLGLRQCDARHRAVWARAPRPRHESFRSPEPESGLCAPPRRPACGGRSLA